jgi:hypothetical protein
MSDVQRTKSSVTGVFDVLSRAYSILQKLSNELLVVAMRRMSVKTQGEGGQNSQTVRLNLRKLSLADD